MVKYLILFILTASLVCCYIYISFAQDNVHLIKREQLISKIQIGMSLPKIKELFGKPDEQSENSLKQTIIRYTYYPPDENIVKSGKPFPFSILLILDNSKLVEWKESYAVKN